MGIVQTSRWIDAADKFQKVSETLHGWLPGPLARIPLTFIGYALINSFTFCVDMVLLWLTHGQLHIHYPVAVTVSFGLAAALAFVLNKVLNFRAHGDLARQSGKYTFVIVSNYVIWILLFSWLLEWLGVHYLIARFVAACCEGLYIYLLSRAWVFRRRQVTAS